VRHFPDERLDDPLVPEAPYTAYTQFIGITQHNLYHAGQIAMLKRPGLDYGVSGGTADNRLHAGAVGRVQGIFLMLVLPESISFPFGKDEPPIPFLVVPALIVLFWNNRRCPACYKTLGGELSPNYCSGCGTQLQWLPGKVSDTCTSLLESKMPRVNIGSR